MFGPVGPTRPSQRSMTVHNTQPEKRQHIIVVNLIYRFLLFTTALLSLTSVLGAEVLVPPTCLTSRTFLTKHLYQVSFAGEQIHLIRQTFNNAFNTITPVKLFDKLKQLGIQQSLALWILDVLQNRTQVVKIIHSQILRQLVWGAPQGCVLTPLLYSV